MPNLQKFADQGVVGNLSTLYPVLSPMLWTSIATGKRAYKHGIHGFAEPDPNGGVRPVTSLGRKTKAIWNILNQRGMRSNIVGWWPSQPAEPINGVMVSNQYQQTVGPLDEPWPIRPGTVHPERLRKSMAELRVHPGEITAEQILPFVPNAAEIDQEKDSRLAGVTKILAECASVHSAATGIMQLEEWDFMGVYYDAIDHFSHGFMKYHPPQLPWISDQDFELYKNVINTAYQFHDLMLGTLMTLAGEDTTVIVVSDHGFHPDHLRPKELPNEPAGPAEEHRPFGIFAAHGPGIKKDGLVFGASLLDITPTILTLFGLPVGRDMDGKPLVTAMEAVLPAYVDSWDTIPGEDGSHPAELNMDFVDVHESLQQLVDLGYIDEPDENQQTTTDNTVRELRYNLARDLFGARRYAEAIPLFQDLWDSYPGESRFGLKLFDCLLAMEQTAKARQALDKIVERKERYAKQATEELQCLLDKYEKNNKKMEDLNEQELRKLQKLHRNASTNQAAMAYLRARLFNNEGEYDKALTELEKAADIQIHNHPSLYQTKGEILMAMGRWGDAITTFQDVLELDPVNPGAQLGLCRCYLAQRGQQRQALEAATTCLGLAYHNPRAHFLCGVALQRLGRINDARRAYETALAQNPVFPAAHRRLARLYRIPLGAPNKANEHIILARAAQKQIDDFYAGKYRAIPSDRSLDPELAATLKDLSCTEKLDSPPENSVVVVSGLPRSGTSMMMQMLEAGGFPVLTDSAREPDDSNPRGYYEYEKIRKVATDSSWLKSARGKAVKIVAPLLPNLRQREQYRVVFMERPLQHVIASQSLMLERLGRSGGRLSDHRLAETYLREIDAVRKIFAKYADQVRVLSVDYNEALANPADIAAQVNDFLGGGLDERAMVASVEPSLRHQ